MKIPGIIGLSQFREEIGGPTKDTRYAGAVTDDELQAIIDRRTEQLVELAKGQVEAGMELPSKSFEPVEVTLKESAQGLAEGTLGEHYFPWARRALGPNGEALAWDPSIFHTAAISPFARQRFYMEGRTILVLPKGLASATVFAPPLGTAVAEIVGNVIPRANQEILLEGRRMLQSRINEFVRPHLSTAPDVEE